MNITRFLVVSLCVILSVGPAQSIAAGKKTPAQIAAKSCLEGKNWGSETFGRELIGAQLQTATRPAKSSSVFLIDPSLGALATVSSYTELKFARGRLTGSSNSVLAGVTSQTGGVRGQSSSVLDARYSLAISKKGAITVTILSVAVDSADTELYLEKFSTFEKFNRITSTQTPIFLKDVKNFQVKCKGTSLKITYPNQTLYTFTR